MMQFSHVSFSNIIRHPSFRRLAAMLRLAMRPSPWRDRRLSHVHDRVHERVRNMLKAPLPREKTRFTGDLTSVLVALKQSDPRIVWFEADMDWLVAQLDAEHGPATMALLLACGSAPDHAISLRELAALTGDPESTWRDRCQRGDVPGASKDRGVWSVSSEALIHFVLPSAQAQRMEQILAQQQEETPGEDNGASDARNTGIGDA